MKYYQNTFDFKIDQPCAISLGKFDGLHIGHKSLMEQLLLAKERGLYNAALTFSVPPNALDGKECKVLSTRREKERIFTLAGLDALIEMPFDETIKSMDPKSFLLFLKERIDVRLIVCGTDFRFGHKRAGDVNTLKKYEKELGYTSIIVEKIQYEGKDISSTRIRGCVERGEIEQANRLLGYPYFITGEVLHGEGRGHKEGIPTVNLFPGPEKLLPKNGVYFSKVNIGENCYTGITNIGRKPTAGDFPVGVETHILDYDGDVYGEEGTVSLFHFHRPEKRFDSFELLKAQIGQDIAQCRDWFLDFSE